MQSVPGRTRPGGAGATLAESHPMNKVLFASIVAVATLPLGGSAAHACSCITGWGDLVAPQPGADDVPVNAKVWIGGSNWSNGGGDSDRLRLVDEAGEDVDIAITEIWGDGQVLAVLSPGALFDTGRSYTVMNGEAEVLSSFRVGDDEDIDAPAVPVEVSRVASSDPRGPFVPSSCGHSDIVQIEVESEGLFVVANITGEDSLDTGALSGEASQMDSEGTLFIGRAGCTFSWPEAEPGAGTEVRFGTFDMAGNFSGWSAADAVVLPQAGSTDGPAVSCSAVAARAPGSLALLLALFGLAGTRRRA